MFRTKQEYYHKNKLWNPATNLTYKERLQYLLKQSKFRLSNKDQKLLITCLKKLKNSSLEIKNY